MKKVDSDEENGIEEEEEWESDACYQDLDDDKNSYISLDERGDRAKCHIGSSSIVVLQHYASF